MGDMRRKSGETSVGSQISFMKIILIWQPFNSLTRRIHLRLAKLFLFAGLGIFFQSCIAIRPADETSTIPGNPLIAGSEDLALLRRSAPVLMIGDSLTVGDFGEALQAYLLQRFGNSNVALYGSCGSSPEHWIRSGPKFITKCGYREQTPQGTELYDFHNGRRPRHVLTPKLEDLVKKYRPKMVIVQLGTNWMDGFVPNSRSEESHYGRILDDLVMAIRSEPNTVNQIVWITPPDSSRYSRETQRDVKGLITEAARRNSFEIIDSSRLTHYVPGISGGDGVHYNSAGAKAWANQVTKELDGIIQR
jgi:lysophospholipase L1-like esterase